jgi:hypothetical protein
MIDHVALVGLFGEVFGVAKNWRSRACSLRASCGGRAGTLFRNLKAAGHELFCARETRLRQLKREGISLRPPRSNDPATKAPQTLSAPLTVHEEGSRFTDTPPGEMLFLCYGAWGRWRARMGRLAGL